MHVKLFLSEAFFGPKCSKYLSAAGLPPGPAGGELRALPQTICISGLRAILLRGEDGKRREKMGGEGKRVGKGGKG